MSGSCQELGCGKTGHRDALKRILENPMLLDAMADEVGSLSILCWGGTLDFSIADQAGSSGVGALGWVLEDPGCLEAVADEVTR